MERFCSFELLFNIQTPKEQYLRVPENTNTRNVYLTSGEKV